MKRNVSMVKMVLVILFALSLVAMLGAGSVMAERKSYSCESSMTFCSYDQLSANQIVVGCDDDPSPWICSLTSSYNAECQRLSEKKTLPRPYLYNPAECCNRLCGYCASGWSDKQSNSW